MNATTLQHIIIALVIQAIPGLLFNDWISGGAFASGGFIYREITQAEYRWISTYGNGQRINMPWWGGFDLKVWNKLDSWMDWITPTIACGATWFFF